jgi:hypothetical protein
MGERSADKLGIGEGVPGDLLRKRYGVLLSF